MMKKRMKKETSIYITEVDLDRLTKLIDRNGNSRRNWNQPYLHRLEGELERAEVVDRGRTVDVHRHRGDIRSAVEDADLRCGERVRCEAGEHEADDRDEQEAESK